MFSSLGSMPRRGIAGARNDYVQLFEEPPKCLPLRLHYFTLLPARDEGYNLHVFTQLLFSFYYYHCCSSGHKVVSYCGFGFLNNDVEPVFMCLLASI